MGGPAVVSALAAGLWRVARGDNPLEAPPAGDRSPQGGNRFDPLSMAYGVLYFGTDLETCFGETLARFRPSLRVLALVQEEWAERDFMPGGSVAADWRQRRTAVHVRLPPGALFLDVDSPVTHQALRKELALGLSAIGVQELDVSTIRGPDRRVTRMISEWAYMASERGEPSFAGIRYESRLRSGWECWAVFDDEELQIDVLESRPIGSDMPELMTVAELFELRIF